MGLPGFTRVDSDHSIRFTHQSARWNHFPKPLHRRAGSAMWPTHQYYWLIIGYYWLITGYYGLITDEYRGPTVWLAQSPKWSPKWSPNMFQCSLGAFPVIPGCFFSDPWVLFGLKGVLPPLGWMDLLHSWQIGRRGCPLFGHSGLPGGFKAETGKYIGLLQNS